jgi:hypothetical protein
VIRPTQKPDNTQHSQETDNNVLGGIWTRNACVRAAADPRLRPLAHTPAFCRNRIRLRSWSFSHVPVLPLPVASTDHVYVASLILNAAQVRRARRANSNAVTLKLISCPPALLPGVRLVEFKSGTLACRTGNLAGPARTGCVWIHPFIYIASSAGVGLYSGFACVCANALRPRGHRDRQTARDQDQIVSNVYVGGPKSNEKFFWRGEGR